ncbi:putative glycosyltransferase [Bacillus sp. TS-2]|nr:putative glycosyltransferase [Bacillus sp. TS-2]
MYSMNVNDNFYWFIILIDEEFVRDTQIYQGEQQSEIDQLDDNWYDMNKPTLYLGKVQARNEEEAIKPILEGNHYPRHIFKVIQVN